MSSPNLRPMASRRLFSLLLCVVALGWFVAAATTATAASKEKITLEFNDVDIKVVVKFISQLVHKNFIVDDAVKGKVTVISPVPVSAAEAYEIFLSILDVKGFAAVPAGRVVKIIPAAEARAKRLPMMTAGGGGGPTDDRIRTQLIQLEHVDASRVVPLLKPLIAKTSHVEAFAAANTILLTDVASNINRILKIIAVIDTPGFQQQLAILPLQYATADKLAGQISSIFGGKGKVAPRPVRRGARGAAARTGLAETEVKVFADERTNSLIVFATKNDLAKVKQLVERLDIAPPADNSRVRIYRLQHAVAEDLANVLTGVESARAKGAQGGARAPGRRPQAARAGARGVLGEGASIIPDAATNSLIVTASPEEHVAIDALIKQLDVQPLQVFVEALIVEVAMTSDFNIGVEWRALGKVGNNGLAIGSATNAGVLDSLAAAGAGATGTAPTLPTGLAIGFLGDTIEFNGVTIPSLGALVTALKGNSGANIISTPQILTLDNKEAEFDSVQTIPFQTGTSTGTGVNVVSTFDFRDVGTKLRITPHINKEGYVRLELHQEVSNVVDSSVIGLPTTSKRSADTVAVVKDNNTIVIGGLISNQMTTSQSKVPILGDIPFLGALFRSTHNGSNKTNLLIFITPHVIQRAEALRPFTEERSRENNLLQGKEFKGMMNETFPQGFPGIHKRGLSTEEGESPVQDLPYHPPVVPPRAAVSTPIPTSTSAAAAAPAATPAAVVPTTPPAASPPAAPADLTERLRGLLSVGAEGGTLAPSQPAAPSQPSAPAAVTPSPPAAAKSSEPAAPAGEGDDLMQRLHQILEEPAAAPKVAAKPATSAAEELHLKEVEQPLFEPPKKRGWFGRTLDRILGRENAAESPETTPDAVSPIYRYTPEMTPPPATGDDTDAQ